MTFIRGKVLHWNIDSLGAIWAFTLQVPSGFRAADIGDEAYDAIVSELQETHPRELLPGERAWVG
jgi:hypothetical protein